MTCGGQKRFIVGLHSNRRQASASPSSSSLPSSSTTDTNSKSNLTTNSTLPSSSPSSSSSNTSPSLLAYLFSSASSSCSSAISSSISVLSASSASSTSSSSSSHSSHLSKNGAAPTTTTGTSSHRITTQGTNCHQSGCGDPDGGRKGHRNNSNNTNSNRNQKETIVGGSRCPHQNSNNSNKNGNNNNHDQKRRTSSTVNNNTTSTGNNRDCGTLDLNCTNTTRTSSGSCSSDRGRTGCTSPAFSTSCWKPLSIMARKRDDKSPARNCGDRQERKMESYLADDENYPSFSNQVVKLGLQLRDIPADGNCLFRALGDQLEGHGRNHYSHRLKVVDYMSKNKKDFAPFVEDNIQFEHYLYTLKKPGTYAGNDAIAAFARLHQVHIVIHQLNSPFLLIQGTKDPTTPQLHIAYHNGDHYSSLRWLHDNTESPANIRLKIFTDDKNKSKAKISAKTNYRDEKTGVARAVRDAKSIEQEVIGATGCQDREIIQKCLIQNEYDVDATIADLLQLLKISRHEEKSKKASQGKSSESGLWGEKGSGSRIFGSISLNSSSSSSTTSSSPSSLRKSKDTSVHYTEDCMSESSGYGSLGSGSSSGARPKLFIQRVRVL